jgi:hypothetical protein
VPVAEGMVTRILGGVTGMVMIILIMNMVMVRHLVEVVEQVGEVV